MAITPANCGNQQVCAVIVSYCPDLARIQALVKSVITQVGLVVIVDNGSPAKSLEFLRELAREPGIRLNEFGENRGIAAAHNAGIRHAMENGYAYVLLLDHDSRLLPDCVTRLISAHALLAGSGINVAAVGPQYHDQVSGRRAPFFRFGRWRFRKSYAQHAEDVVETSILISSGSLISRHAIERLGMMDETLFIDGVDWEWCFRAASQGYRLFGVASASMLHSLGDSGIQICGRVIPLHGPIRHYYVYRNTILLCRMRAIPFSWKVYFSGKLLVRFAIYMMLAPQRLTRCRLILKGLVDGVGDRRGRIAL